MEVRTMPIVIKSDGNQSSGDIIRRFKKATVSTDVVQKAKDRRYFTKPSKVRAQKKIEKTRLRRRARVLKHTKNVSPEAIEKLYERIETM
jgi:ribosomal protein S21